MKIKLGQVVIKKNIEEGEHLPFKVTGFDNEYAVLKGIEIPIVTIAEFDELIVVSKKRKSNLIKRIK